MNKKHTAFAILGILIFSLSLLLLFLTPGEASTKAVSVILSAVTIGFGWYTFTVLRKEREEEKKLKVTVWPNITHMKAASCFELELTNHSAFEIPIKSIQLNVRESRTPFDMIVSHNFWHLTENDKASCSLVLPPRTCRSVQIEDMTVDRLREICGKPHEDVWIDVHSHTEKVSRLDGQFVALLLARIVDMREAFLQDPLPPELAHIL